MTKEEEDHREAEFRLTQDAEQVRTSSVSPACWTDTKDESNVETLINASKPD